MSAQGDGSGVFGLYAAYYDLLYRDKDYAAEAAFVAGRLRARRPGARSLLELGCGTGRHAARFAEMGFAVTGVDRSEGMLEQARAHAPGCSFLAGDIRELSLSRRFDAVVSLFHVMSYQTTDADLGAALACAGAHLVPGGLLLFDFWHGPAVRKTPPEVRVRQMADERVAVTRRADPVHHEARHVVDVRFSVDIREQGGARAETVQETHAMRYFFVPELVGFLAAAGLELLEAGEWMSAAPASADAWSVYCLAEKRA